MKPNRVIVITGVTRGLGYAMAGEFIRLCHTVVGCGRSRDLVEKLRRQWPSPHSFDSVDVVDEAAVAKWAEAVLERYGPPDLLLNNAGIINNNAVLWKVPREEFEKVVDINIKGVFHVIRHFVPAMVAKDSGVIVNFSSGWGRSTAPQVAPYCATKWAIEGLTRSLAQELPSGMAAIPIDPGIINTDMLRTCFGTDTAQYISPEAWAAKAVPFFLRFGPKDNGQPLRVGR